MEKLSFFNVLVYQWQLNSNIDIEAVPQTLSYHSL